MHTYSSNVAYVLIYLSLYNICVHASWFDSSEESDEVNEPTEVDIPGCIKSCESVKSDKQLICEHRGCSLIPTGDNEELYNTEEIHMSGNTITNISNMGTFYYLTYLDVSSNLISYIETEAFSYLHHLTKLNLADNRLTEIKEQHFKGLYSLKELYLDRNQLSFLTNSVFQYNLKTLTKLNLGSNMIKSIDHNAFTDLPDLKYLNLQNNLIEIIRSNHFLGLDQLKELYLNQNQILTVPTKVFQECADLTMLDLSRNWINTIEPNAFLGLYNIEILQLSTNKLRNVTIGIFNELGNLQSLYLSQNPIRFLQPGSFPINLHKIHLNDMPRLSAIKNNTFTNLQKLSEFEMTNCKRVSMIESGAFMSNVSDSTSAVTVLNLYNNSLMTLSEGLLDWDNVVSPVLGENDWVCDCNLLWIKQSQSLTEGTKRQIVCHHPHHLKGQSILEVDFSQFSCSFFSQHRYGLEIVLLFFVTILFLTFASWMVVKFRHTLCSCLYIMPGKYSSLYKAVHEDEEEDTVKLKIENPNHVTINTNYHTGSNGTKEEIIPGPTSV